jgi:rhodanese-related sulfurtransferase
MHSWRKTQDLIYPTLRDAIIIAALCALLACIVNFVRPDSLDWFAERDYDILVPCPEPIGEATAMSAEDARRLKSNDLLIDARQPEEFARWHAPDSINIVFDYLTPISDEAIRKIAAMRAHRIIVAGDGQNPDSGEQLAKEISGRGIKNVHYLIGGMARIKFANENHGDD